MKSSAMVPSRSSTLSAAFSVIELCCLTLMQACSDSHTDSGGYPTGYEVGYRQRDSVFWVEETRLVFAGMPSAEMRAAVSSNQPKAEERLKKLYLWDRKTKTATLYADAKFACFSKGNIRYATHIDEAASKRTIREGPLGSEQETEVTVPVLTAVEQRNTRAGWFASRLSAANLHLQLHLITISLSYTRAISILGLSLQVPSNS